MNPDNSRSVRNFEVPSAKVFGCVDMEAAIIAEGFSCRSLFCSNWVVPHPGGLLLAKTPENPDDLADHLGIDSVSKPQCALRFVRMGMNEENALLQIARAAQIASVSFEKNIEKLFPRVPCCGFHGRLDSSVDGDKSRAY